MSSLKLKIPPPIVLIVSASFMWLLSVFFPATNEMQLRIFAVPILAVFGMSIAVSGISSFKRAQTTVNPTTPEKSSSLVTTGIYKFTRNPMYLGLLFLLLAWSVFLSNLYSAVILVAFVVYMTEFQIKPEEEALRSSFGEEYESYKNSVRRWL